MNYIIYDLETNGVNVLDNSIMQKDIHIHLIKFYHYCDGW